jgi:outer membrane protein
MAVDNESLSPLMQILVRVLFSIVTFGIIALDAQTQTAPKIVIVDIAKIFDNHYETQAEKAKLDDAHKKALAEVDEMNKEGNALVSEYKALEEQSKSPLATAEAKAKAVADAQKKGQEIQAKLQDIRTFENNAQQTLNQRIQTFRSMVMDEISKIVVQVAKRHNATLVFDKSGPSLLGVPAVLYYDSSYEITEEVMTEIKQRRPGTSSTAAPTGPSPSAGVLAPASEAPKIMVPGITNSSK